MVPVVTRVNPRAKRMILRVKPSPLSVVVTLPPRHRGPPPMDFVETHRLWVEAQLTKAVANQVAPDCELPSSLKLLGESYGMEVNPTIKRSHLCEESHRIFLKDDEDLVRVLKLHAQKMLPPLVREYAKKVGIPLKQIVIKDARTKWGSCSSKHHINLNWRLILTPLEVAHYVCAHEAAHLIHMNHSKDFWGLAEILCPNHKTCRAWLRKNGGAIMEYRRK